MQLRPYQETMVQKGLDYFKNDEQQDPVIIVAPTAAGKSLIISAIANELEGKTVVVQPSVELLNQNLSKLIALGGTAGVYSAGAGKKVIGKITYATIGSIKKLGKVFKEYGFTNVICDECDRYPPTKTSMWGTFLEDLGATKVLGLTATPFRLQTYSFRRNYSQLNMLTARTKSNSTVKGDHGDSFWKEIIHVHQIRDIVSAGYWTKLEYELYDFDTGKLVFNSTGTDYTDESIQAAYLFNSVQQRIADWVANTTRKHILIFVPTVSQAHALSYMIPGSAVVWGDMDKDARANTIRMFRSGAIRVVINVNVLSVGFDYPEIDAIVVGRPTASLAWFYQAVGRGTRIFDTKPDCVIVDFVGNTQKFGRLENLSVERHSGHWGIYSGLKKLTGVALDSIGGGALDHNTGEITMPFGKYQGKKIDDLDFGYLKWLMTEFTWKPHNTKLRQEVTRVYELKLQQSKEQQPTA